MNWRSNQCMRSQKDRRIELYYLHFVFDHFLITERWIDFRLYYYIDQSNDSLIVWWLFKKNSLLSVDWSFCQLLKLIYCRWRWKWWTDCGWACGPTFWGHLKQLASEKDFKKNYNLCTKLNVGRKYKGKTSSLNLIWG